MTVNVLYFLLFFEVGGDIKTQADVTDMDEAEYIDQTRKALTRQDMGDLFFEYQVRLTC